MAEYVCIVLHHVTGEDDQTTNQNLSTMTNHKATIQAVNAAFEKGSVEEFLTLCTPDVRWTMVGMGTWEGADTIRANWTSMMAGAALPVITEELILADGDAGMGRGIVTMQRKDGSEMTMYYCDVYRFSGEKITELSSYCIEEKAQVNAAMAEPAAAMA
jgi:ketosteroid isomerase-like protein